MNLLLDLGNTRLKWALADAPESVQAQALAWEVPDLGAELVSAWRGLPVPTHIYLASVAPDARREQVEAVLGECFDRPVQRVVSQASACGVRNAYAEPSRLGVDRFLALLAAHDAGHSPCVLAGCGTALTLDALAADGRHLGGWIAPGPALMRASLLGATAKVRPEHPGRVVDAADNTADAVASGCWHAAAALVERFATRIAPMLGGTPALLLGGGDAESLASLLTRPSQVQADTVLRGLAVWARDDRSPTRER